MYEQEADRIADQVMRMPEPGIQRSCGCGGRCAECSAGAAGEELEGAIQPKRIGSPGANLLGQHQAATSAAAPLVQAALAVPGTALEPGTRGLLEGHLGRDFQRVRVHVGAEAGASAEALGARAYTVGSHIVFGRGEYEPATATGRRLLAHELVHVIQQAAPSPRPPAVQRQVFASGADADLAAEREYGDNGAPRAQNCGRPSWCPPGFCDPYRSEDLAKYYRAKDSGWLMLGISAAVNSRVVPLWREYLAGGSAPKNLSSEFGADFTNSPTTKKTTDFLNQELQGSLTSVPPSVPMGSMLTLDLGSRIGSAIAELDDPTSAHCMNFNVPRDIPGNLVGGVGKDQVACPAGAKPSPYEDERHASGSVAVMRLSPTELYVLPKIQFSVKDTIDLCPGDCGTRLEQAATVPLSQFEATGISGDIPLSVDFPAPPSGMFTIPAPLSGALPATPKKPPASGP
jgi:hypothetical protein